MEFTHTTLGQRVLFGSGLAAEHCASEVERLGARRVMLIVSESQADLGERVVAQTEIALEHREVRMHVPVENAKRARTAASKMQVDAIVSVGGGSTVGLAKAVALTTGLPIIAVPTTYAGSEATDVWGLTEDGIKTTGSDARVLPRTVIYDADLTLSLPQPMSIASGLNGLAHCFDSLWGPRADPINQAFAAEGIRSLSNGLPKIAADPGSLPGREDVLCGAYLAAVAFASAGSGLHHKICHVLGGAFDLPHAQTHAVVLPYVVAFNAPFAPEANVRAARALGTDDALNGLQKLRAQIGAPMALCDYGFNEAEIARAVELVLPAVPANNPRVVTPEGLKALLTAALQGDDPGTLHTFETGNRTR